MDHSYVKDNYLFCEKCKKVCNHHISTRDERLEHYKKNMRKRTIYCRGGHDVEEENFKFDRNNKPSCKLHPDKTWRWKVISVRGK